MLRYACVNCMAQHSMLMLTLLTMFIIVTQQSILSMHCIDQRTQHFILARILFIVTIFFYLIFLHAKLLKTFQPQENKSCPFSLIKSSKIVVKMNIFIIFETK